MVYYANGGFTWQDVYFMPIKLREFYWRELLKAKEEEREALDNATSKSKSQSPSKIKRR